MKTKYYFTFLFLLIITLKSNASPLTNLVINNYKNDLNGVNGYSVSNSYGKYCGKNIGFFSDSSNAYPVLRLSTDSIVLRSNPTQSFFPTSLLNCTNGFYISTPLEYFRTEKPNAPGENGLFFTVSEMYDSESNLPINVLTYSGDIPQNLHVSLTDSVWNSSCRIYITNAPAPLLNGIILTSEDFLNGLNSLFYRALNGQIICFNHNNFTDSVQYVSLTESNSVLIYHPEYYIKEVCNLGDINGDNFDDLIIGGTNYVDEWRHDNSKCWILFGGKDRSNIINLATVSNDCINFTSIFPDVPNPNLQGGFASLGWRIAAPGDVNADGLNDFIYTDWGYVTGYYPHCRYDGYINVCYGSSNLPAVFSGNLINGYNGFQFKYLNKSTFESDTCLQRICGNDINRDGYDDVVVLAQSTYIFYGGPFYSPLNGFFGIQNITNGFVVLSCGETYYDSWNYINLDFDCNSDNYYDLLIGAGNTDYLWMESILLYGGQSPSAPPALRTPLWINVGESNSLIYDLDNVPTNIVWTGCKKGDDFTFCYTNGVRCPAWDIPMGKLWFTNSYTITSTDDFLTVSYTSTNALGPAAGFTTLTIEPMPEPALFINCYLLFIIYYFFNEFISFFKLI